MPARNPSVLIATQKAFAPNVRDAMVAEMTAAGLRVSVLESYSSSAELQAAATPAEGLIVRSDRVDAAVLEAAPALRLIVRAGAGYDTIDVDLAQERGIIVENTPGQNANAVAELAIELMLAAVRPLDGKTGTELTGKTLGICGFGNIGRIVARLGRAFGMLVRIYDVNVDLGTARQYGVTIAGTPEALYDGAHVVSLHIPENATTRETVTRDRLLRMAPDGVLVNTARPGIIHEPSLLAVLAERPGFRYAADVAPSAAAQAQLAERFADRVRITPRKQGAQTLEANRNAGLAAARQTIAYFTAGDTTFCVYKLVPPHLKDYTRLARQLGRLNAAFIANPRQIYLSCYGELNAFRDTLGEYVLKGLFTEVLGEEATPHGAAEYAAERGLRVAAAEPDNTKGYGNALTIDFVEAGGASHSSRGRIDEGQMEASRIGEFKSRMPLDPGLYVLATYREGPGMADRVGHLLTDAGYNRVRLGAGPNLDNTRAQAFFQAEKKGVPLDAQRAEIAGIAEAMRGIADVHDVKVIDLT